MAEWIKGREVMFEGPEELPQRRRRKVVPGILKCECGEHVTISHDGVECSKCKQPYNLFGQRLRRDYRNVEMYGEAADYMNEGE
jgi:hypothetical protein